MVNDWREGFICVFGNLPNFHEVVRKCSELDRVNSRWTIFTRNTGHTNKRQKKRSKCVNSSTKTYRSFRHFRFLCLYTELRCNYIYWLCGNHRKESERSEGNKRSTAASLEVKTNWIRLHLPAKPKIDGIYWGKRIYILW